jgi:hypothetical protein
LLHPDFDLLDVPRDRFVIAGDAWARCRAGEADPSTFGIFAMRGLWFIAGNLMRDVAALNHTEMLPWDVWGAMIRPDEPPQSNQLALFDRLATVTRAPDAASAELRALYEDDERLRVPATVFNSRLNRRRRSEQLSRNGLEEPYADPLPSVCERSSWLRRASRRDILKALTVFVLTGRGRQPPPGTGVGDGGPPRALS